MARKVLFYLSFIAACLLLYSQVRVSPIEQHERVAPETAYPDPTKTPGAVMHGIGSKETCAEGGYTGKARNVSAKTKQEVYKRYGVSYPQPMGKYEVDHFIPLTLGGSNDISNLWLEPAEPRPGFHEKDKVELFLRAQVCAGAVSIEEAQQAIKTDWVGVYEGMKKYPTLGGYLELPDDPEGSE